jgi:hypothetical protein
MVEFTVSADGDSSFIVFGLLMLAIDAWRRWLRHEFYGLH